jgi:hypothetical protein
MRALSILTLCIIASLLPSCGLTPVYKEGSEIGLAMRAIKVADPKSEIEFKFLPQIQQKFPQPNNPSMYMNYSISLSESGKRYGVPLCGEA